MAFANQKWALDIRISRTPEPRFIRDHWWRLPRKWTMLRSFVAGGSPAKVSRTGNLRIYGSANDGARTITLPDSDDSLLWCAFVPVPRCVETTDLRYHLKPVEAFRIEHSDKGRYLLGTLRLFVSISGAYGVISDRFWQSVLLDLSAPAKNRSDATRIEIVRQLQKRLKRSSISSEQDWNDLSDTISNIAPGLLKSPNGIISFRDLLKARRRDIKEHPSDHIVHNRKDFEEAVQRRVQTGVLSQGHQWRCWRCYHYNWTSLENISQELTCEVCAAISAFPPRITWDFQVNEFLSSALREHGTLPLIWCLGYLHYYSHDDFLYTPPLDVYRPGEKGPYTDVDICCIHDGRLVIGEAKEKGRNFNDDTVTKLVRVAEAISADTVVLACLEQAAKSKLDGLAKQLLDALPSVQVQILLPDDGFGLTSSTWLP